MENIIQYIIKSQAELNLSYMPFIKGGGIFIPTEKGFLLGIHIIVDLQLPGRTEISKLEGKIIWVTPKNSRDQIYAGIGVQIVGDNANAMHQLIKENLDSKMDVGGYSYGLSGEMV